jgi:hypothetical protein
VNNNFAQKVVEEILRNSILNEQNQKISNSKNIINKMVDNVVNNIMNENVNMINQTSNKVKNIKRLYKNKFVLTIRVLRKINHINFENLNNINVDDNNIINNNTISLSLENINNDFCLIELNGIKILIKIVRNAVIITNINNNISIVVYNDKYFSIGTSEYLLTNNCKLIIPVENKKVYNNKYNNATSIKLPKIYVA